MKLLGYWRSSATYRVRIALTLKGLVYDYEPVNLLNGEQKTDAYLAKNPLGLVPTLVTDDGATLNQSLAIIEYLEETHPTPSLMPDTPDARAAARAIAATLSSEAQPMMNLRIQQYLKNDVGLDQTAMMAWLNRWPGSAMAALEQMVHQHGGDYCVGDQPGLADCFLVPQMYGALRFGIDVSAMTKLNEIYERCIALPAFQQAHPDNQIDAVKE